MLFTTQEAIKKLEIFAVSPDGWPICSQIREEVPRKRRMRIKNLLSTRSPDQSRPFRRKANAKTPRLRKMMATVIPQIIGMSEC